MHDPSFSSFPATPQAAERLYSFSYLTSSIRFLSEKASLVNW